MDSQALHGLSFRKPNESEDFERIAKVVNESWAADGIDAVRTADELEKNFANPIDFNPKEDCLIVQAGTEIIGFSEVTSQEKLDGEFRYWHYPHLLPGFRFGNLRRTMITWNEERIRTIAAARTNARRQFIEVYANTKERNDWKELIVETGYVPTWYLFEMVRSNLEKIPDYPFPDGVETRPVRNEDLRKIWNAAKDALKDQRDSTKEKWNDEGFEKSTSSPGHDPRLWQIAWHGDQVVGGVLNYIDTDENESLGRKWGHTEEIFVVRPWRKKGVARALIARSLRVIRDHGMEKATLDVDTENPSGALGLYKALGYEVERQFTFYHKELR